MVIPQILHLDASLPPTQVRVHQANSLVTRCTAVREAKSALLVF